MSQVAEVNVRVTGDASGATAALNKAESSVKGFVKKAGAELDSFSRNILQGIGQSFGQFGIQAVGEGIKGLAKAMIGGNAEVEKYTLQFKTLLGTLGAAKDRMAELRKFADTTPFETGEVVRASKLLQVFGGDALATGESLRMVGDAAATSGAKFDEIAFWVGRAYTAIKGGQPFGEASARLQELGLVSGPARAKLEELTKSGGSAQEAWKILTGELDRSKGAMAELADSFDGRLSTLQDTIKNRLTNLGGPMFDTLKNLMKSVTDVIAGPGGDAIVNGLASIAASVGGLVASFAAVAGAVRVFGVVKVAMLALTGPVGWIIAAVGLIYVAWQKNWGGIRDVVKDAVKEIVGWWQRNLPLIRNTAAAVLNWLAKRWEEIAPVVVNVWKMIVDVVKIALKLVLGTVKIAMQLLTGDWAGAWETIKQTAVSIWPSLVAAASRGLAALLEMMKAGFSGISQAWHNLKEALGIGDGGQAAEFTGLDGSIAKLKEVAGLYEAAAKVADTFRRVTGGGGKADGKDALAKLGLPSFDLGKFLGGFGGAAAIGAAGKGAQRKAALDGLGGVTMGGGSGGGGAKKSAAEKAIKDGKELSESFLESAGRYVRTPKGLASCAFFASAILGSTGVAVGKVGGAKALADAVLRKGGQVVGRGEMRPGDLVLNRGRQYGAAKDGSGVGHHVQIATGRNEAMDSSGGRFRINRKIDWANATVIRPKRSGAWNVAADAVGAGIDEKKVTAVTDALSRLYDLKKRMALGANASESAGLAYDLKAGRTGDMPKELFAQVVAMTKAAEASEALTVKRTQAKEATDALRESIRRERLQLAISTATNERDRASLEMFGKRYDQLTDAKNRGLAKEKALNVERERGVRANQQTSEWAAGYIEQLSDLAAGTRKLSQEEQAERDIRKAETGGGRALTGSEREAIIAAARAADGKARDDATAKEREERAERERDAREKGAEDASNRYGDSLRDLAQRIAQLNGAASAAEFKTRLLAESFGSGATQAARIADGMSRARDVMARTLEVEKIERFNKSIQELARSVEDRLMGVVEGVWTGGFRNLFSNVATGFRSMLTDMAREWAMSQIRGAVSGFLTGALGSIGGASKGKPTAAGIAGAVGAINFRAVGGPVLKGRPYVVGERGPETFVPSGHGRILTAQETKGMRPGGDVHVHVHGVTDAGSFQRSERQIRRTIRGAVQRG